MEESIGGWGSNGWMGGCMEQSLDESMDGWVAWMNGRFDG